MRHLFFYFLFLSFSCNIKQHNSQQNTNNEGKPGQDTIRSVTSDRLRITPSNITSLIPEFSNDTNFHNISGIAVGTDLQKNVIYTI